MLLCQIYDVLLNSAVVSE